MLTQGASADGELRLVDIARPCALDAVMAPDGALHLSDLGNVYRLGLP